MTLAWHDQWEVVGFVLAAKSIARIERLDDQSVAETYLAGTMISTLVAVASALLLRSILCRGVVGVAMRRGGLPAIRAAARWHEGR